MKFEKHDIKLIILSGKAHSGKSLVADMINDYYGSKCISISYAYYIKDYLSRMNRYSELNFCMTKLTMIFLSIEFVKILKCFLTFMMLLLYLMLECYLK